MKELNREIAPISLTLKTFGDNDFLALGELTQFLNQLANVHCSASCAGIGSAQIQGHQAIAATAAGGDQLDALGPGGQGSFSLPFDGWLVRGGEARSIEAATVAGDIRQVLKAIVGFEGEAKVTPDGLCPLVWVEGLSITGEA